MLTLLLSFLMGSMRQVFATKSMENKYNVTRNEARFKLVTISPIIPATPVTLITILGRWEINEVKTAIVKKWARRDLNP